MNLFIPDIGTLLKLEEDWQITLYNERRNFSLFKMLKLPYKSTVIDLPKGLIIKVDRVYIRKGLSQYSSLTFTVPKPKTKKEKLDMPVNVEWATAKFWVKLHECNTAQVSPISFNPETTEEFKKMYIDIEQETIQNFGVEKSTQFLKRINNYLGTGQNLNNLNTSMSFGQLVNSMITKMEEQNEPLKEYLIPKFRSYSRDFKLKKLMS